MTKEIDDLNAIVGKVVADFDSTLALAQVAAASLHAQLDAALAQDGADKAELEALKAAAVTVTTNLNTLDGKITAAAAGLGTPVPPAVPVTADPTQPPPVTPLPAEVPPTIPV